jgi:hypothetical protein
MTVHATVLDYFNNPVPGASVAFSRFDGSGSVTPTSTVTASDGTTSAQWKMGPVGGVESLLVQSGQASTVVGATSSGAVNVTIDSPVPFPAFGGDSVRVEVTVTGDTPTSLTASISGRQTSLQLVRSHVYEGYISLVGLPAGLLAVAVTVDLPTLGTVVTYGHFTHAVP